MLLQRSSNYPITNLPNYQFLSLHTCIQRVLSYFANGKQRVFGAGAWRDPLLFRADDVQQQLLVCRGGHPGIELLAVFLLFHRLAGVGMEKLSFPLADVAVELDVRTIQRLASRFLAVADLLY